MRDAPAESSRVSRAILWLPEILFLAAATAAGLAAGGRWMDPVGDPGFSWSLAYRLAHGERLYRDVYLAYGPLSPYLLALWARIWGVSVVSILVVNWTAAMVAGVLLLRVTRFFLSNLERVALVGMILATSLFVPGAGRLVLPYYAGVTHAFAFALAALLLLGGSRPSRPGFPALAGALAGLAFCCKQEIGLAALAALLLATLAGIDRPLRWGAGVIAGFGVVALAAGAFALSAAPIAWLRDRDHLWPLNPRPPAAFDVLFRSVSGLSEAGWPAALRRSGWNLLAGIVLFGALGGLLARERSRPAWRRIAWLSIGLAVWWAIERFSLSASSAPIRLSVVVSCLVAMYALLSTRLEGRSLAAALGLFAALTGMRALVSPFESGPYEGPAHFVATASWALFLLVIVPRMLWPAASSARAARMTRAAFAIVLALLFGWTAAGNAASLAFPWKEAVDTPNGRVYTQPGQAALFREIGRRVRKGERVLVLPEINAVDALFELRSVSPLLHHFPGWLDPPEEAELIRRLDKDPPSKVILFERPSAEFGIAPFGKGFGVDLLAWCTRNYRVVWSSPKGAILERAVAAPLIAGKREGPAR